MAVTEYQYSPHDLCVNVFVPLNCDGSPATETDTYTLAAPLIGGESAVTVDAPIDADTTPPWGELTINEGTVETLGYGSFTGSTFNLITGTTVQNAHASTADTIEVARSRPIVHCGLTQVRLVPLVTDEVVDQIPGGQANQNIAFRRIAPQPNGYRVEADLQARENPFLWAYTDQYAPVMDPDEENAVIGFEENVTNEQTCPTCGGAAATCHTLALIQIYNAWCGEERLTATPYVALTVRSLEFEPSTENIVRGRGFPPARIMRASLRRNSLFADPWGVDPRGAGQLSRWTENLIKQTTIDANADLAALLTNGCGCGACPNPSVDYPAA